jgi:hypothetical protein
VFDPGNIFGDRFGGGGSQPTIPPGYYRHVHYPAAPFIGSPYAITPNMEDSFHREAPFGGKIIWVSQASPALPGKNGAPAERSRSNPSSVYNDCVEQNLYSGPISPITPLCYLGAAACSLSKGDPFVCVFPLASCAAGIGIKEHCINKAEGSMEPLNEQLQPPIPNK